MSDIVPDKEVKHGWHRDMFYPGFIRSVWKLGPVRLTRERKYAERTHRTKKTEAWIISLPLKTIRIGTKVERDV